MKKLITFFIALFVLFPLDYASAAHYRGGPVNAKLASEEIEGDFMTVWGRRFSAHMEKWSDGKIRIAVYPYGTLGASGDINELAQMGVVQFVFSDHAWISSFVPQAQALALHYLFPSGKVPEILDWMARKGRFLPLLEEAFRKKGLVPLSIMFEGWQWVSAKKAINSLEDMENVKLRLMSSKMLVENYRAYGASPTPMSYGEVYSGLQMGLIDGQVNPLFAAFSMKFYEVQDYFAQLRNEPFISIPTVNQTFFDGLPEETREEIRRFWIDAIIPAGEWIHERNLSDMKKMKASKPSLTFRVLDEDALTPFKTRAQSVYPLYGEIGGEGAENILKALLKDIANAKKALSIN